MSRKVEKFFAAMSRVISDPLLDAGDRSNRGSTVVQVAELWIVEGTDAQLQRQSCWFPVPIAPTQACSNGRASLSQA